MLKLKKKITLKSDIINDKHTSYVYQKYDIQNQDESITELDVDIDIDFEWNIGVLYGGSGSGKSTILNEFGEIIEPDFDMSKTLISNFDFMEPEDAAMLLTSMGLSSIPSWLRPYRVLSNGEQYRAKLAMLIAKSKDGDTILVDEFTSVVDRDVAKAMSNSVQKYIRRTNKKIILASCHYDIMEWLTPDWIYSPMTGRVERPECLRRPGIELTISRVDYKAWGIFQQHHYLTEKLNRTSKCYLAEWNGKPVGICCVLPLFSGTVKKGIRLSRTVVLPDFQGLGIGSRLSEYVSSLYKKLDYRPFTKTINPALGEYREKSDKWKPTAKNGKKTKYSTHCMDGNIVWDFFDRPSYCYEYVGEPSEDNTDIITFKRQK